MKRSFLLAAVVLLLLVGAGVLYSQHQGSGRAVTSTALLNGACGSGTFSQAWAAVPTSNATLTTTSTCLSSVSVANTTGAALTFTVTSNEGTPTTIIPTQSIAANQEVNFALGGTLATSGVIWKASGAGLTGSMVGLQ